MSKTPSLPPLSNQTDDPENTPTISTALNPQDDHSTASTDSEAVQEHHDDAPADPRLTTLRAMFPDYDDSLLLSILESVSGDQNRAIDALLGMSDPQYKSDMQDNNHQSISQVDLDEQLARRLMLEDQQAQQLMLGDQQAQQRTLPYEPYAASTRRGYRPQQPQPQVDPNGEKDTMTEIQDQITRIAESGKKTFESLFSKVKAKIQEYDRPGGTPEVPNHQQPAWQPTGTTSNQRWSYTPSNHEQPSYYDPNLSDPSPPPRPVMRKPVSVPAQGYDVDTPRSAGIADPPRSGTSPPPDLPSPRTSTGSRPVTTIDGGKLGLLPKRPVSLLKPQGAGSREEPTRQTSLESSDGLEYAENPFEEPQNRKPA